MQETFQKTLITQHATITTLANVHPHRAAVLIRRRRIGTVYSPSPGEGWKGPATIEGVSHPPEIAGKRARTHALSPWVLALFAVVTPCAVGFGLSYLAQTGPVLTHTSDTDTDLVRRDGMWHLRTTEPTRDAVLRFKGRESALVCGGTVVFRVKTVEVTSVDLEAVTDASLVVSPTVAEALAFQQVARTPQLEPAFQENAVRQLRSIEHEYYGTRIVAGLLALPIVSIAVVLLSAAPLAIAIARRTKSNGLLAAGLCGGCGYDRRGLVGGAAARCPECGTLAASAPIK